MKLQFFGDSYDIVKKSLLTWLFDFGPWAAHPMFTHATSDAEAAEFSHFLGVPLVSTEVLYPESNREEYFASGEEYRSLFLDPDTGIRMRVLTGQRSSGFLFANDLVRTVHRHPDGLTLTFDGSLARGQEREQVLEKLSHFEAMGAYGFAYVSHVSFVVLGHSADLVQQARKQLLFRSALPARRIVK